MSEISSRATKFIGLYQETPVDLVKPALIVTRNSLHSIGHVHSLLTLALLCFLTHLYNYLFTSLDVLCVYMHGRRVIVLLF